MNTKKALMVGVLAVLFVGWGITSAVLAQEGPAFQIADSEIILASTLGAALTATDVYHVHCGPPSGRLGAQLRDNVGVDGVRISMAVSDSGGNPAVGTTALDGGFSPIVFVNGGLGNYTVAVFKSPAATVEAYLVNIQCQTLAGANTATTVTLVQNQ